MLKKEILLITKQKAYQDRILSIKGQKDKIDIISLIFLPDFDLNLYLKVIREKKLRDYLEELRKILEETKQLKELNLNQHSFAKRKKAVLQKL